jgi:hypothetical protein
METRARSGLARQMLVLAHKNLFAYRVLSDTGSVGVDRGSHSGSVIILAVSMVRHPCRAIGGGYQDRRPASLL